MAQFFSDLAAGDPWAWGYLSVFLVIAAGLGLITLKFHFQLKREDEARAKRYGRRK